MWVHSATAKAEAPPSLPRLIGTFGLAMVLGLLVAARLALVPALALLAFLALCIAYLFVGIFAFPVLLP